MVRGTQFSIATILCATLAIAVFLQFGQIWSVAVTIGTLVAIFIATELLIRSIPAGVEQLYRSNCARADGSWSANRAKIENAQFRLLRSNIQLIVTIAAVPWVGLTWFNTFSIGTILFAVTFWLFASFVIVRSGYVYYLKQHIFRMKVRAQNFKLRDLHIHFRQMEQVEKENRIAKTRDSGLAI